MRLPVFGWKILEGVLFSGVDLGEAFVQSRVSRVVRVFTKKAVGFRS